MQSGSSVCHTKDDWHDLIGSAGTLPVPSWCGTFCAGEIPDYGKDTGDGRTAVPDQLVSAGGLCSTGDKKRKHRNPDFGNPFGVFQKSAFFFSQNRERK